MKEVKSALTGGVAAIVSSLPIAMLFAYLFRLPIPLGGYIGPFGEVSPYDVNIAEIVKVVIGAWIFYGVFGGYIILFTFGAIGATWIGRKYSESTYKNTFITLGASIVSGACIFVLSILDYLIGPW